MLSMLWYGCLSSTGSGRAAAQRELDQLYKQDMQHNSAIGQGRFSPLLASSCKGFRSTVYVRTRSPVVCCIKD